MDVWMKKIILWMLISIFLSAGCSTTLTVSPTPTNPAVPLSNLTPTTIQAEIPWPTHGWIPSSPEAQGMDSTLLARMLEDISTRETRIHSVLVIRNGYLVTEAYFHPYTRETKSQIQSVTKSVISMLVGRAITRGEIQSTDQTLVSFFPGRVFPNLTNEKASITLSHLLSMSSGLDCEEFRTTGPRMEQTKNWVQFMLDLPMIAAPGTRFGYCNGNAHLLSAILEKRTGLNARLYANRELFTPLGISGGGTGRLDQRSQRLYDGRLWLAPSSGGYGEVGIFLPAKWETGKVSSSSPRIG